jgi:hypothetical protein
MEEDGRDSRICDFVAEVFVGRSGLTGALDRATAGV